DVRAPITPRKPGRSASIRGDEDREKRRAPQPPSAIQGLPDLALQAVPKTSRHQQQDSIGSNCSSLSTANRSSKGPAPPRPQNTSQNHDNESYECDSSYDENVSLSSFPGVLVHSSEVTNFLFHMVPCLSGASRVTAKKKKRCHGTIIPCASSPLQLPVLWLGIIFGKKGISLPTLLSSLPFNCFLKQSGTIFTDFLLPALQGIITS
ncbi:hypothetical protein SK128_024567, partial [Halocaridina rubra]